MVSDELPQTSDATSYCKVNGLHHWHPPFTCLDEDIKHMEVWSLLSKRAEQILLDIDVNTHGARKPLSTTTSTRNPHSPQVWSQSFLKQQSPHITASGQWVEQFASSLHMPRRKHQEHGSLERSIQIFRTSTVENTNQHEAL